MRLRLLTSIAFLALLAAGFASDPRDQRFTTTRASPVTLPLTDESDSYVFAVFGDRTGGPPEGLRVLEQAVADVNLLHPDLVMTVGDLIQGYNEAPAWLEQAGDYKRIMGELKCPWFPVSGNHDIYWRGKGEPPSGEHESNYEQHFGPLWYAFEHKNAWFVALHSDEGHPETGEKNFNKPECQRMSEAQFEFLRSVLARARDAEHVFVFLHHPRWLGRNYGDDWERVHELLRSAGNVRAVFAGHIHHMRYDGPRDGIEYFTLATVGGDQSELVPAAGYLHQYSLVTVRKSGIDVSAYPVGGAIDPRSLDGALVDATVKLARELKPRFEGALAFAADRSAAGEIEVTVANPSDRPIEVQLALESRDSRWRATPDHTHLRIKPGATARASIACSRPAASLDSAMRTLELSVQADYLGERVRVPLPRRSLPIPFDMASVPAPATPETEHCLALDGARAHLALEDRQLELPDGPFTVEAWVFARRFKSRQGLICKTEQSEFGLFANGGEAQFTVHVGGRYVAAQAERALAAERWTHIAGVFDGEQVLLFVDGEPVAARAAKGARKRNALPLVIGGDVKSDGEPDSLLDGALDEVRISSVARYAAGKSFTPARRHENDADTRLLLHMDGDVGLWAFDASPHRAHALRRDGAVSAPRP